MLDLLVLLLENYNKQDQLYLLMFEPEAGELLYGLLTIKGYTIIFYEKVVKVRKILVNIVMGWNIKGCELVGQYSQISAQ